MRNFYVVGLICAGYLLGCAEGGNSISEVAGLAGMAILGGLSSLVTDLLSKP